MKNKRKQINKHFTFQCLYLFLIEQDLSPVWCLSGVFCIWFCSINMCAWRNLICRKCHIRSKQFKSEPFRATFTCRLSISIKREKKNKHIFCKNKQLTLKSDLYDFCAPLSIFMPFFQKFNS